jgi:polysaccharide pyruvyl transferase WcaK-like protein
MDLPDPADLRAAIGVGGGYLRSADPVHEAVFRAHHLPQLRLIARMGVRGAYLPISVGPFRRGLGRLVRWELASVGWVAARDDRSARYLAGWGGGWRMPDLAACRIGVDRPALQPGEPGVIGVVLRSLPRSDLGFASVSILEERGLKVRYGLQSSSGRTNDDRSLYAAHGVLDEADDFGTMLASSPRPSAILAGRLHAALDAIAAGIPAIHVGYERKSLGAFSDLGLADYVIDAWTGVPGDLADRIVELAADPEPYWERLWNRFDPLADRWAQLVEGVSRLLSAPAARRGWR